MNNATIIESGPMAITEANRACVVCRAKNEEDTAECMASLALCEDQPIFVTLCAGMCLPHRRRIIRTLATVMRPSLPPLSIETIPEGDRHAVIAKLEKYAFPEIVELFLHITQACSILEGGKVSEDSIKMLRRHVISRMEQEKKNPDWLRSFIEHMASELRNVRAARMNLAWKLGPAELEQVQELWAAISMPY